MSSPKPSSRSKTASRPAKVAASPFNKAGADVTLLSSDGVQFHVYKTVLILASRVFDRMFSSSGPSHSDASSTTPVRPVTKISEDSRTIDALLRLIYPVKDALLDTLEDIEPVLAAAMKYEAVEAQALLSLRIYQDVYTEPMEVFALACRLGLSGQANRAATRWGEILTKAKIPAGTAFSSSIAGATLDHAELNGVTAGQFRRLLRYLRSGTISQALSTSYANNLNDIVGDDEWGCQPLFSREDADLIARSSDNVDFRIHRSILSMSGGDELISHAANAGTVDNLPVLKVDASANVLAVLLLLCYPSGVVDTGHGVSYVFAYSEVLRFARRYNMSSIADAVRANLAKKIPESPLTAWCIATQFGWEKEAATAADVLCMTRRAPLDALYNPELEKVSAREYGQLLKYHHERSSTIKLRYNNLDKLPLTKTGSIYSA